MVDTRMWGWDSGGMENKEEILYGELKVGDEVIVTDGGHRQNVGIVRKIGPKLVHISGPHDERTSGYYLDTQTRRDGYPGQFQTLGQHEEEARCKAARKALSQEHSVEVYQIYAKPSWTADQLEELLQAARRIRGIDG